MHRLALCLVVITSTLAAPRPAVAAVADNYDTIDFAEVNPRDSSFGSSPTLTLQGILAGTSAPVTKTYFFNNSGNTEGVDTALQCQRLALLVMSKPGKFQFGIGRPGSGSAGSCRITRVTP
jgi:hypothetical protein